MITAALRILIPAGVLTLALLAPSKGSADIIVTGGTLTGVTPPTIGTGYGPFDATQSKTDTFDVLGVGPSVQTVQTAHVSGSTSPSSIALNASATTYYNYARTPIMGDASGTIGFDLTDLTTLQFSLSNLSNSNSPLSLSLTGPGAATLLGCVGNDAFGSSVPGGCALGSVPNQQNHGPLALTGFLELTSGHYDLTFSTASGYNAGRPDNTNFSFSLTTAPVPLPAALPLLLSGLASFGALARRGRRAK